MSAIIDFFGPVGFSPRPLAWINGFLFALSVCINFVLGGYIYRNWTNREPTGLTLAVAISVYVSGDMVVRFWTWVWRLSQAREAPTAWMDGTPWLAVGTLLTMVGALCCIREFSPHWGWRAWFLCAFGCAAFSTIFLVW